MTLLPPELAALLGDPEAPPQIDLPRPPQSAGHGRSGAAELDIARLLREGTVGLRAPPQPVDLPDLPLELARLADHEGDLVSDSQAPVSVLRGRTQELEPGVLLLRSDQAPVSLQVGGWLVDIDAGRVRAWPLDRDDGPGLPERAPVDFRVPAWDGLPVLLGGRTCPAWLAARVEARGRSVDPLTRLAGAGLLGRLWEPSTAAERSQAIAELRAGRPQPATALRAWLAGVAWPHILAAALARTDAVADALETQGDDSERLGAPARLAAGQIVEDRDDLASLAAALRLGGADPADLDHALDQLDGLAAVHGSTISALVVVDAEEPWLQAVFRHEPEHWWGALVR